MFTVNETFMSETETRPRRDVPTKFTRRERDISKTGLETETSRPRLHPWRMASCFAALAEQRRYRPIATPATSSKPAAPVTPSSAMPAMKQAPEARRTTPKAPGTNRAPSVDWRNFPPSCAKGSQPLKDVVLPFFCAVAILEHRFRTSLFFSL